MNTTFKALLPAAAWVLASLLASNRAWPAAGGPAPGGAAPPPEDGYIEYTGTARARHAQRILYQEHHFLAYRAGRLSKRLVLYTCPNGAAFARKQVNYVDSQAPDFFFEDASNGMQEGVRTQNGERSEFFRANRVEPEKSAPLPKVTGLVADAGFDEFIRAHWSTLMTDDPVPLHFLVPSRLQALDFEVRHLRSDRADGRPAQVFRLQLAGLLGLVLPGIEVTYDAADRVLVRFEGISDLRDASGDNLQASIVFPVSDRRPGSAQSFATAEQASIAPCH
jgi:hypothetical protein